MATKKELEDRIAQLEGAVRQPIQINTITVAYGQGSLYAISMTCTESPKDLLEARQVLMAVSQQLEASWRLAVLTDAGKSNRNGHDGPESDKVPDSQQISD